MCNRLERCSILVMLITSLFALFPEHANAELITNGSFELPVSGPTGVIEIYTGLEPIDFGWTVESGTVEVAGDSYPPLPGPSFDGGQRLDLNGISLGTLSQELSTLSGTAYQISFAYANNYQHTGPGNPALATVQVFDTDSGDNLLAPFIISHGTSTSSNLDWTVATLDFFAIGERTTLRFVSNSPTPLGGILLDGVTGAAAPVPEPSCIVLLFVGLFGAVCYEYRGKCLMLFGMCA